MSKTNTTTEARIRRHSKVRTRVIGSVEKPRLSVYRSNNFIYAQLIDDAKAVTIIAVNDMKETAGTKIERAKKVGTTIAALAAKKGITKVAFDRGGFKFWGRIKAVAEGAREGGLLF